MTDNSPPQFTTAEYADRPAGPACRFCTQKISGSYYRVNGAPACAECTQRLQAQIPQDSHGAFVRAVLFGVGAAVLGLIIYVVFALSTGLVIGYVSLAVGYLVGKGIALGSRGVGGRRYQIAAVVLTYMAVSLAAVPIAISMHREHASAQPAAQVSSPGESASAAPPASPAAPPKMSFGKAVGVLVLLGLASPFLDFTTDPLHGLIGLIILLVGIRIAWQLTAAKTVDIAGPIVEQPAAASG